MESTGINLSETGSELYGCQTNQVMKKKNMNTTVKKCVWKNEREKKVQKKIKKKKKL